MHFLRKDELYSTRHVALRAAVMVEFHQVGRKGRRLVVDPPLRFARDAEFARLPPDVEVVDSEGNPLEPTWGFWVSTETFNPYHLVTDWDGSDPKF